MLKYKIGNCTQYYYALLPKNLSKIPQFTELRFKLVNGKERKFFRVCYLICVDPCNPFLPS
jgi:hypothetical protein